MEIPLCDPRVGVAGYPLQPVQRHTSVSEPGQSGVSEVVTT